jgi:hypothetical protein
LILARHLLNRRAFAETYSQTARPFSWTYAGSIMMMQPTEASKRS